MATAESRHRCVHEYPIGEFGGYPTSRLGWQPATTGADLPTVYAAMNAGLAGHDDQLACALRLPAPGGVDSLAIVPASQPAARMQNLRQPPARLPAATTSGFSGGNRAANFEDSRTRSRADLEPHGRAVPGVEPLRTDDPTYQLVRS